MSFSINRGEAATRPAGLRLLVARPTQHFRPSRTNLVRAGLQAGPVAFLI
jgi:hypothetical protein